MTRYHVVYSDGNWRVKAEGVKISNHRKKSRAIKRAKRTASEGDSIYVHKRAGPIQRVLSV